MVHSKIKKHPQFLFVREPLKSYKRVNIAHCLGGEEVDVEAMPKSEKRKLGLRIVRECEINNDKRRCGCHSLRLHNET